MPLHNFASHAKKAGQKVAKGDALASIEAMKMETMLHAEQDGVVAHVHVRPGLIRFGYTPGSPCDAGALPFEVSITPAPARGIS